MAAITRPASRLARGVNEFEPLDRFVRGLIDFFARTFERVELNLLRELFAESRRAGVIGQQHNIAGSRQQVIVPAQEELIAPHRMRAAVDDDEEWILFVLVEVGRQRDHAVDLLAAAAREGEMAERLPVNLRGAFGVETGQSL